MFIHNTLDVQYTKIPFQTQPVIWSHESINTMHNLLINNSDMMFVQT